MRSPSTEDSTGFLFGLLRVSLCSVLVLLSFGLPISIILWSIILGPSRVRLHEKVAEIKYYDRGMIHDGQLWFITGKFSGYIQGVNFNVQRLDLKTGLEHKSASFAFGTCSFLSVDDDLYLMTNQEIYQNIDSTWVKVGAFPRLLRTMVSSFFPYEGKLTFVVKKSDYRTYLAHLVDGEWMTGREILIPPSYQTWYDIEPSDLSQPPPLWTTSFGPMSLGPTGFNTALSVVDSGPGEQPILFLKTIDRDDDPPAPVVNQQLSAAERKTFYRRGFEFADKNDGVVSALLPENSAHEVTGWKPLPTNNKFDLEIVGADADGLLFAEKRPENLWATFRSQQDCVGFCRLGDEGNLKAVRGWNSQTINTPLFDASRRVAYVVEDENDGWNSVAFRRIEGDHIQPVELRLNNGITQYLNRWMRFSVVLLFVWLLHYVLVTCAAGCLGWKAPDEVYEVDLQQATLASVWRRMTASTIDLIIGVGIFIGVRQCLILGFPSLTPDERLLGNSLYALLVLAALGGLSALDSLLQPVLENLAYYGSWFGTVFLVFGAMFVVEIRLGITPGKWLLGIRTRSSSLIRVSLIQSIIRKMFCAFDFFLLMTPIPALIFMQLSKNRRRPGDFFAQAIVIKTGSIRDIDFQAKRD